MPTSSLDAAERRRFRSRLLKWYETSRRALPWREQQDFYHVWLSEIMLQQTRVNAVLQHYSRFLESFPTLDALTRARKSEVLAAWSGLGYYRRAVALHAAARQMARSQRLPRTAEQLQALPGVGRYTSAAIASICFAEPVAVVDGNVERVLACLFRTPKKDAWTVAGELLSRTRPGDFNQAMMELGATICLPRAPLCPQCPVYEFCVTRGAGTAPAPAQMRHRRHLAFGLARRDDAILLLRRPGSASLMPGMWELPQVESQAKPLFKLRHAITITDYRVAVHAVDERRCKLLPSGQWVRIARLPRLPLTGLTCKILRQAKLI